MEGAESYKVENFSDYSLSAKTDWKGTYSPEETHSLSRRRVYDVWVGG